MVIFQRALLYGGVSRVLRIAFLPCSHKFQLQIFVPKHRCAIGLKDRNFLLWSDLLGDAFCQCYTALLGYEIYIGRCRSAHKQISHITPYGIDGLPIFVCNRRDDFKEFKVFILIKINKHKI